MGTQESVNSTSDGDHLTPSTAPPYTDTELETNTKYHAWQEAVEELRTARQAAAEAARAAASKATLVPPAERKEDAARLSYEQVAGFTAAPNWNDGMFPRDGVGPVQLI